jgi:hypothetical protein
MSYVIIAQPATIYIFWIFQVLLQNGTLKKNGMRNETRKREEGVSKEWGVKLLLWERKKDGEVFCCG